jgi:DNA ligase (NAD+)
VQHFAHRGALDIEGLGHTIIGQLLDRGLVRRVDHIYDLTEEKLQTLDRLGPKSIANLLTAIAKSKEQPFWRLLFGLGIPHIGATAARELADFFGTMDALQAASLADLLRAPNTGEIVAQSVVDWFSNSDSRALLAALRRHGLNFGVQTADAETGTALGGQTWVITGTLGRPREELAEVIRRQGGRVATSVSKKTDFLLVGADAGSKLEKAKELGVKTVTEAEFNRLLGEG